MFSARQGFFGSGMSAPAGTWTQISDFGTSAGEWWLSYSGLTLWALKNTAFTNGTATIYSSTGVSLGYAGITWTTGATFAGTASAYASGICALSNTNAIVQHRASFFRTTDSGATVTNILNSTGSGQNNYYIPCSDGTYGLCNGYEFNVVTTNNWVSATKVSKFSTGFAMATAALTNNGGNRFLNAGLGSSGSSATAWIIDSSGTTYSSTGVTGNQNMTCSDPANGRNAVVSQPEGGSSLGIYFATYPSTSYSTSNITGLGLTRTGYPCISPEGRIIVPMGSGLWKVYMDGSTAPVQIAAVTNITSVVSDGTTYCYAIGSDGKVYRFIAG